MNNFLVSDLRGYCEPNNFVYERTYERREGESEVEGEEEYAYRFNKP